MYNPRKYTYIQKHRNQMGHLHFLFWNYQSAQNVVTDEKIKLLWDTGLWYAMGATDASRRLCYSQGHSEVAVPKQ
jgi:hypothetical protein